MSTSRAARVLAVLFLSSVAGAGCGGGGGSGNTTATFVPSTAANLQSNGTLETTPGMKVGQSNSVGIATGLRFGLFPFLDHADTIVSARLVLRQMSVTGTPYPDFGSVVVDVVDYGASLGAGDQSPPVSASAVGTLSSDATLGLKEVDVTSQVAAAAAADSFVIDFRLRFSGLVLRPSTDIATFEDPGHDLGTPDGPQLIVQYR